ncbi:MAG: ribonuclease domain-containing protein [Lachnospiraceae bacterium]
MRCVKEAGKKAGRFLTAVLLVLLCVLTGIFSGCAESSLQISWSSGETDAAYSVTDAAYSETDAAYGQGEDRTGQEMDAETVESTQANVSGTDRDSNQDSVTEDGIYTSPEQVALYIHLYGHLPSNYITKKEAEAAGWDSSKGNLWEVADGMSIGGSRFGNYEGALPDQEGRRWYECDVNYEGGYRGAERLLYSSDGLIYYTGDHYKTFEQIY